MDVEEILVQARQEEPPPGWVVLPLLRNKLIWAIIGWALGVIIGLGLFALILPIVVPYNFVHGAFSAIATTFLLGVLLFIGLGSAWSLITDIRRISNIGDYLIVITREDFVKQEGQKRLQVPLLHIRHITARGTPPPDRSTPQDNSVRQIPGIGENVTGFFFGRGIVPSGQRWRRRRMRTPTTLAFVDGRTNDEVLVVNDASYGDPFMIAATLKQYAASAREMVM